jgi:hypothetical protein
MNTHRALSSNVHLVNFFELIISSEECWFILHGVTDHNIAWFASLTVRDGDGFLHETRAWSLCKFFVVFNIIIAAGPSECGSYSPGGLLAHPPVRESFRLWQVACPFTY